MEEEMNRKRQAGHRVQNRRKTLRMKNDHAGEKNITVSSGGA